MSISKLIDDQPANLGDMTRQKGVVESVVVAQVTDAVEVSASTQTNERTESVPAAPKTGPHNPAQFAAVIQSTSREKADQSRSHKPVRGTGESKREESGKEIRRTLVADEGQWSSLKNLSESFADDVDDDDSDDPAKKTIAPYDE